MSKFVKKYHLQPGDVVVLPKSVFNLVQHYAIYIGLNQYGIEEFIENKIGQGVVVTPADQFFPINGELTRIDRFQGSPYDREILIRRAKSQIGKSYHAMLFNCEHLTTQIRTWNSRSRQVENLGLFLAGAFFLRYLLSNNSTKNR